MSEAGSLIQLLLARLERISADSPLAHRASGIRGALLRALDTAGSVSTDANPDLRRSVDAALDILSKAAAIHAGGRAGPRDPGWH
jgi:hypothetical protein